MDLIARLRAAAQDREFDRIAAESLMDEAANKIESLLKELKDWHDWHQKCIDIVKSYKEL